MSEIELADYCRRMGLFVEQVKELRVISIQAHEMKTSRDEVLCETLNRLRELEKEFLRKDKAMAEAGSRCTPDIAGKVQCPLE